MNSQEDLEAGGIDGFPLGDTVGEGGDNTMNPKDRIQETLLWG